VLGEAPTEKASWISQYEGDKPTLLGCEASSKYNNDWGCLKGLNGDMTDAPNK